MVPPYAFTLETPDGWFNLYQWLRDTALVSLENISPDKTSIAEQFGPDSPAYQRDIAALKILYQERAQSWRLSGSSGAYGTTFYALPWARWPTLTEGMTHQVRNPDTEEMDDLFVRHTYLSAVIGMVVQASFGIDIRKLAEVDPADLPAGSGVPQRPQVCRAFWNRISSPGPTRWAATRFCRHWPAAWRGSTGPVRRRTPPPTCTRRSSRRRSGGSWGNITPRHGWPGPWSGNWWSTP